MARGPSAQERQAQATENIAAVIAAKDAERRRDAERRAADPWLGAVHEAAVNPLRPMTFARMMRGAPQVLGMFKVEVPGRLVSIAEYEATVECPCGERPTIPAQLSIECACGRWYIFIKGERRAEVRVIPIEEVTHDGNTDEPGSDRAGLPRSEPRAPADAAD